MVKIDTIKKMKRFTRKNFHLIINALQAYKGYDYETAKEAAQAIFDEFQSIGNENGTIYDFYTICNSANEL